ncbi:MAG: DUF131 domain-containing protein [Candidatus Bathyarchaeia archaeon]
MSDQFLFNIGVILVLAGFIIAFAAVFLLFFTTMRGKGKVRGGGAVIIGPFPIIFGTDRESVKILLLLSIALVVLVFVATVFYHYVLK